MAIYTETATLNTGAKIPVVGLGTWLSKRGEVKDAVKYALDAGYRHIDAAAIYNNEEEVGEGIKDWYATQGGDPKELRKQIFVTSKLWNNARHAADVEPALDESLKKLGLDYLDLYLIHWPVNFASNPTNQFPQKPNGEVELADIPIAETWGAMEKLLDTGKVKAIGVSNFNKRRLEELLATAKVVPAVNQIEAHPWLQQPELKKYLEEKGIHITAYSPLGNNIYGKEKIIESQEVIDIVKEASKIKNTELEVAQVLIAWAVARGTSVVPKSINKKRIEDNIQKIDLPEESFKKLNALDRNQRYNDPVEWNYDIFDLHKDEPEVLANAAKEYARTHPI